MLFRVVLWPLGDHGLLLGAESGGYWFGHNEFIGLKVRLFMILKYKQGT